jgi:hypothetical protein
VGQQRKDLSASQRSFIEAQHLFFVATAAHDGRVNLSPKGMDSLRVLGPERLLWLNLTGSGNETAAHLLAIPRMTLMWCAFEGSPMILRAYGQAQMHQPGDPTWAEMSSHFPTMPGARQVFDLQIELVQSSCGMAVPCYSYQDDRQDLLAWADRKGPEQLNAYQQQKNRSSLDGLPTGLPESPSNGGARG